MKWLISLMILTSTLNAFSEEKELTRAEIRMNLVTKIFRSYPEGMSPGGIRPRFNLSGNEVGWEVNDMSQGHLDLNCKGAGEYEYRPIEVDIVDTVGNANSPGCADLEEEAISKMCQYMLEKLTEKKVTAQKKGLTCDTKKSGYYSESIPYPFVDDEPYAPLDK